MDANQRLINNFYAAFARLDAETMVACYAPDARFDDEAFSLHGQEEVAGMWRMLCAATREKGADVWKLSASGVEAGALTGKARWVADYRFSATGCIVHNVIDSRFEFNPDGLIQRQRDTFDLWKWSRQALGAPGLLRGWTPFLHRKIRARRKARTVDLPQYCSLNPVRPEVSKGISRLRYLSPNGFCS